MKTLLLNCTLALLCTLSSFAGEWPVYSPSEVVSMKDPGNTSQAEIRVNNIVVNDKVDCSSGCNWTLEMTSPKNFLIWNNSQPLMKEIGHAKRDFEFSMGIPVSHMLTTG